ncbi:aldo/keto reductase [Leptolyngbya iicbica]|uniref:Aldo/keto reductase n=2 Tax=Cyanophyceae TaxID=3028117 RepID=A0A4Q7E2N3_9CYAN|nr:aldo/keto reductase [Leptolyngbya sp. LK]RZM76067.1 aldo/keto reductase [Leptolyngbya sp. LK]
MSKAFSTRRRFLYTGLAATSAVMSGIACKRTEPTSVVAAPDGVSADVAASDVASSAAIAPAPTTPLPTWTLGRSPLTVPVLGLGGSASPLSRGGQEAEAIALIEQAYAGGIRYFDTAANYGPSEERLGKVLPAVRSEVMIGTKTSRRDRDEAWRQLEQSLQRLQTDYIDLWQFHAITYDWDVDTLLDEQQGAIKAAAEAKEQGIIRAIGITGHNNPEIFVKALNRYPFDTALIPINAADRHTPQPFIDHVLPVAQQHNTGIIGMKVPAYGRLFQPGVLSGMTEALGYALSQPQVHCCIVAADTPEQLAENLEAARGFEPFTTDQLLAMEQRTAQVWQEANFFRRWS